MEDELSTAEAMTLIDHIATASSPAPILVLTGGDCLMRGDIVQLASYARKAGIHVAISPSVTPRLRNGVLEQMRAAGVTTSSLSLDGACATTHDGIRGIPGLFDATGDAMSYLMELGFRLQINTTVMAKNAEELADIAALMHRLQVPIWEVFFLIGVGRGVGMQPLSARDCEDVCHFLVDAAHYGLLVRTVEAPFFRRVQAMRASSNGCDPAERFGLGPLYTALSQRLLELLGPAKRTKPLAPTVATRDGLGIIFVAYNGDVYPSGFMPTPLGNVREAPLYSIYRDDPTLQAIRAGDFPGACGSCDYTQLCGGSRARAWVSSGNPLGDDPACWYTTA